MFTFKWIDPPDVVFMAGWERYVNRVIQAMYAIMVDEAPQVEQFMRQNATWHDSHDPSRSYLKAVPFLDLQNHQTGIVAYYDLALYSQFNPKQDPQFEFGIFHEILTFPHAGIISIILPRKSMTVLGDEAPRIWDRVRALFM